MYDPNAAALIEEQNRVVYELEAEVASQLALTRSVSVPLQTQYNVAQDVLNNFILTRTTAQGAVTS